MNIDMNNPIWSIAISVISIVFSIISIYISYLQLAGKSLTLETIIDEISRKHMGSDFFVRVAKLKRITWRKLDKLVIGTDRLIVLRIINNGIVQISKGDFDRDMVIDFGENSTISSIGLVKTTPNNLRPEIKLIFNKINIAPLSLNNGNSITIAINVSNYNGIHLDAHISGVKQVRQITNTNPIWRVIMLNISLSICISFGLVSIFNLSVPDVVKIILTVSLSVLSIATFVKFIKRNIFEKYTYDINGSQL